MISSWPQVALGLTLVFIGIALAFPTTRGLNSEDTPVDGTVSKPVRHDKPLPSIVSINGRPATAFILTFKMDAKEEDKRAVKSALINKYGGVIITDFGPLMGMFSYHIPMEVAAESQRVLTSSPAVMAVEPDQQVHLYEH